MKPLEARANREALVDSALVLRDMRQLIRQAIEAIDRESYVTARALLKQALDETPGPQQWRKREIGL
jgi:hypothetical protein